MPRLLRRPRGRVLAAAALVLAAAVPATPLAAQRTYTSLTMFGDSFSDVGNAQALFGASVPARFSNGPVWSDVLGAALGRTADVTPAYVPRLATGVYAVGGALTTNTPTGTGGQIANWATRPGFAGADASGLYVLFAGGNDVRGAAMLGTEAAQRAATVAAATNLITQAGTLTGVGARSILLAYLPDLGLTPDRVGTPASPLLSELTTLFNRTLEEGIRGLRTTNPAAAYFDLRLDNLFANVLADVQQGGARYGFTNATQGCTSNPAALPACTGYVFFDGLHPSSAAHQLIGNAAYQLVAFDQNVAVVPEPATIALVGGGLLVLGAGAARRRRRAA